MNMRSVRGKDPHSFAFLKFLGGWNPPNNFRWFAPMTLYKYYIIIILWSVIVVSVQKADIKILIDTYNLPRKSLKNDPRKIIFTHFTNT